MKCFKSLPGTIFLLPGFFMILLFTGCQDECQSTRTFIQYEPVYKQMDEFRNEVTITASREIDQPGRLYYKDGYLFINEPGTGIHIIDNRNISNPTGLSFLEIPGNFDLAAKGNYLYADSYLDLVIFDISDVSSISEVARQENVFLESYINSGTFNGGQGILVEYSEEIVKTTSDCEPDFNSCPNCIFVDFADQVRPELLSANTMYGTSSSTTGIGGSMARFTIADNFLYTLDQLTLRSFDITQSIDPQLTSEVDVGWGMETIFPYNDYLFLGATNGMHIYSIEQPGLPSYTSSYSHVNSCDPVVVQGNYAYVTLRDGNNCGGFTNQLDILDISNINSPQLINTVEMQNPHGLGIDGYCLFVCEGDFGLKFFDASNVMEIENNQIRHYKDIHALDVIPLNNNLMMIGNDGLHQYSYNCTGDDLLLLSTIPFGSDK